MVPIFFGDRDFRPVILTFQRPKKKNLFFAPARIFPRFLFVFVYYRETIKHYFYIFGTFKLLADLVSRPPLVVRFFF